MGIQASLTGHLVFSTLHTNDAPSAITRMVNIGVPEYLVASSVVAILAQRLVRTICKKCSAPHTPSKRVVIESGMTKSQYKSAKFRKGKGTVAGNACNACQKTGYRGRIGIYELLIIDSTIRQMIFDGTPTNEVREYAVSKGMSTLYTDGLRKVAQGITTFEEVFRVAKRTEQDD